MKSRPQPALCSHCKTELGLVFKYNLCLQCYDLAAKAGFKLRRAPVVRKPKPDA